MSDLVEIGHSIITCPRCGQIRHVPMFAACRPVADATTTTFRGMVDDQQIGQVHVDLRPGRDGHRCGQIPRSRAQPATLTLIPGGRP